MLALSRFRDQEIVITVPASTLPTTITHSVIDIRGDKVRLGFTAPDAVSINRKEVQDDIDQKGPRHVTPQ